ncbi:MAG: hypothetical protein KDA69_02165 [Planctomycetaceae bacterium]|nr:hypothetical protein [Planctomycetaceae bacterium]
MNSYSPQQIPLLTSALSDVQQVQGERERLAVKLQQAAVDLAQLGGDIPSGLAQDINALNDKQRDTLERLTGQGEISEFIPSEGAEAPLLQWVQSLNSGIEECRRREGAARNRCEQCRERLNDFQNLESTIVTATLEEVKVRAAELQSQISDAEAWHIAANDADLPALETLWHLLRAVQERRFDEPQTIAWAEQVAARFGVPFALQAYAGRISHRIETPEPTRLREIESAVPVSVSPEGPEVAEVDQPIDEVAVVPAAPVEVDLSGPGEVVLRRLQTRLEKMSGDLERDREQWGFVVDDVEHLVMDRDVDEDDPRLQSVFWNYIDAIPVALPESRTFRSVIAQVDRIRIEGIAAQGGWDPSVWSENVILAAEELEGKRVVLVGGTPHEATRQMICDAFRLRDLDWATSGKYESPQKLQQLVQSPDVAAVFILLRCVGRGHAEDISVYCRSARNRHILIPGSYLPDDLAAALLEQSDTRPAADRFVWS